MVVTAPFVADVGVVEEPTVYEAERLATVLGGMREGVDNKGKVVDLVKDVGVWIIL